MSQNKVQLIEATLESLSNVSGTPSDGQVLIWNAASGRWEPAVPPEGPAGPAGPAGRTVLSGTGVPGSGVGSDGDFYIDTATSKVYGPKTAGAWGSGASMVGPAGATGATGAAGSTTIVPPGDTSFSNVSLLLLGEGADGGTTFADSSSGNRTVSISGSNSAVTISTAQKKFGSSSIWMQPQFTINVKHPTVTHSSALDLSNTAFTIEGWFYFTSFFGFNWSHLAIKDSSWALKITSGGHVAVSSGSFSFFPSEPQVGTVALNTWHHVAVVCDGANVSFYWNGVRKATKAGVFSDGGGAFRLGAASSGAEPMAGYIDNFRITKGVARYSGESFSPPTSAFVPSATTVLPSTPTAGQTVSDGSALYVCTSEATQSWSTLGSTGPAGPVGPVGPAGSAGAAGASAYQVALSNGFVGTEAQWLASLVGAAGSVGPAGQKGDPGDPGADGASAYEVAVAQGFVGTEQQWLASLVGPAGEEALVSVQSGSYVTAPGPLVLLHFEGAAGSQVYPDSGSLGLSVTNSGCALQNTSVKFGSTALNTNGYISFSSPSLALSGDWTFECWLYHFTNTSTGVVFCNGLFGSSVTLRRNGDILRLFSGGVQSTVGYTLPALDTWYHVALVRSGGTYRLYVNGVAAADTLSNSSALSSDFRVNYDGTNWAAGRLDELRISNTAVYTSNFTPPTAAFSDTGPSTYVPPLPSPSVTGQTVSDGDYLYLCTAGGSPGTWKKVVLVAI